MKQLPIRIVVIADPSGNWTASGWSEQGTQVSDQEMIESAQECIGFGTAQREFVVTVTLELPETPRPPEVQGKVEVRSE